MNLFTIGYEKRPLDAFLAELARAGVRRVVDVRAVPWSRRPAFAATPLRLALGGAGLDYVHAPAGGNPLHAMDDDAENVLFQYAMHLDAHPESVEAVRALLADGDALLCYEASVRDCHRGILAGRLTLADPSLKFVHL